MWEFEILGVDLYHVVFWVFLYSFLGWIWESSYVSFKQKRLVNRGFVTGPVCTIYGIGAMSVYLILRPLEGHGLWLFLGGVVTATALEYVTAAVMEAIFHTSWWDYSDQPFNVKGRICLGCSIVWGFFTLVMFEVLQPFAEWVIGLFSASAGHMVVILCTILYGVDFVISVLAAASLGDKMARLSGALEDFTEYVQSTRIYESVEEIKEALEPYRSSLHLKNFQEKMEEYQKTFYAKFEEKRGREHLEGFRQHLGKFHAQYQEGMSRITGVNKRFLHAYPNLHRAYLKRKEQQKENHKKAE